MKRLVVLCDGTWNRADHVGAVTNVVKLHRALAAKDADGNVQLPWYEKGVGTGRWDHLVGGALGVGLSGHVLECYRFLIANYEPGDKLYFFGFSRGSFTARSLAGLVRNSGILRKQEADRVKEAYRLYRNRNDVEKAPRGQTAEEFRDAYSHPGVYIDFVGVWDTVGALGIPVGVRPPLLLSKLSKRWTFHDTTLSSYVLNAYHAISIDERRGPFKPTLWVEDTEKKTAAPVAEDPAKKQTVEQAWFAGVHSDVGGGYSDASLSDIPLLWMAAKARGCGLVINQLEVAPNLRADLGISRKFPYTLVAAYDRRLRAEKPDEVVANARLASSAKTRFDEDAGYRPPGLDEWLAAADQRITPVQSEP